MTEAGGAGANLLGDSTPDAAALLQAAAEMALPLDPAQALALSRYLDLLERWNAVYNLTSLRARADMRLQHLVDCMAAVGPLLRVARTVDVPRRILDVGSGGGLPSVVLAVLLPHWQVVSVDSVGKKTAFVQQVAAELELPNLTSVHSRVEALAADPFGVVTARAFSTLSLLVDSARHCLAPGGVFMAMKGKRPDDELAALPGDVDAFHVEPLRVPGLAAERCIVWMRLLGGS